MEAHDLADHLIGVASEAGRLQMRHYSSGIACEQKADASPVTAADRFGSVCDLCQAAQITPWYHEDDVCWIAECEVCAVPMVVWRVHGTEPSDEDRAHMLEQLGRVATERLGEHRIDGNIRNIPDHFHVHARPVGGFYGPRRSSGPRRRSGVSGGEASRAGGA